MPTYLKNKHPDYYNITIDSNSLQNLHLIFKNNSINNDLFYDTNENNPNYNLDPDSSNTTHVSAVPSSMFPTSLNQISRLPQSSNLSILPYESTDAWLSKIFFYLFPDGRGDSTRIGRTYTVTLKDSIYYYLSQRVTDEKGCKIFPFQLDNSFISVAFIAINKMRAAKNIRYLYRDGAGDEFNEEVFTRAINDLILPDNLFKKIYNVTKNYQNSFANLKRVNNILSEIYRSQSIPYIFVALSETTHKWGTLEDILTPEDYDWKGTYKNKVFMVKKAGLISISLLQEKFDKMINFIKTKFNGE